MRISYEWLKSMVDVPEDPSDLVAEFVRTGTEVEAVEKVGADLTNVVTAQVVSKKPHPDSDHMWLCQVSVGDRNVDADGNASSAWETTTTASSSCPRTPPSAWTTPTISACPTPSSTARSRPTARTACP